MKCKSNIDIRTALENRKAFHPVSNNQTAEDSIRFLEEDNINFIKDNGVYSFDDFKLKTTVTKDISKFKVVNPFAKVGTFIHESIEQFSQDILKEIQGLDSKKAISKLKGLKKISVLKGNFNPDLASENNLFEIAKNQILYAYEEQHIINVKTNTENIPVIKFETKVIDPVASKGGTLDFLAILSDNTFIIRDYATKSKQKKDFTTDGNLKNDLFYYKDIENFKSQVSEYATILRKYYGLAGTRSNRIIPIAVETIVNKQGVVIPNIKGIRTYEQDPKLTDIVPFSEKTGFESLDKFIESIDKQILELESKKNKSIKNKDFIIDRITKLEELKKEILIKKTINNTLEHSKNLVSYLKDMEKLTLQELMDIMNEFKMLQQLSGATYDLRKYMVNEGKDTDEMESKIGLTVNIINDTIEDLKFEIFNKRVNELVKKETGESLTNQSGEFLAFAPEGAFSKWFYQLSQYNHPIFKTLRSLLDDVNYETKQQVDILTEQVIDLENAVYNQLKAEGKTWSDFIKLMINPKTDNFFAKADSKFLENLNALDPIQLPNYYEIQDWYDWRNKQSEYQKVLEVKIRNGEISEEDFLQQMSNWDKYNSLALGKDGSPLHSIAWQLAKEKGKLKLKENVIELSKEYNDISKHKAYKDYYDFFQEQNIKFRNMLGVEYKQLPNNFVPNIRKITSERIDEFGLIQGSKSSVTDFLNNFSIREDDRSDQDSYLQRNEIPKFFLNPFKDKDGKIITGEKSYQFGRSLLLFAKMAYNYNELSKVEAEILALREVLLETGKEFMVKENDVRVNFLGNKKTLDFKESGQVNVFDKFVNMYMYGMHVEPIIGDKSGASEKMLLEMKNYFTLKKLGLNFISATGSFLAAKLYARLASKTGIFYNEEQYNKSVTASGKDRKNFLALSGFFDVMGHRFGNIRLNEKELGETQIGDMSQKGWVNQYVNTRLLMLPYSLGDQNIEEVVTYAVSQNYYVDSLGNLKKIKNKEEAEQFKDRTIDKLFQYKDGKATLTLPEDQIKDVVIAFRRAVQVVQSTIKGTIPNEDKAMWQSQIHGQLLMNFKSWMPAIVNERFGKVKYDSRVDTVYMGKYIAIAQEFGTRNHNATGEVLELKAFVKLIVLPKFMQLLSHLLSFHTIGGYFKGYKVKDDGSKLLMFEKFLNENPQYAGKISYEEFLDIQEKQLKSAIIEMRLVLTFLMLSVLVMQDWDEDGEKDYKQHIITRKLVSTLLKVNQEISFMLNPIEFANLTKNPIPMIGLLTDAQKTIGNSFDELLDHTVGEERKFGGQTNDEKNIGAYSHQWVPGVGGLVRFFDVLSEDVQYENTGN